MLGICTRTVVKVGMVRPIGLVKSCHLVKPVSATLVTGRYLTQQEGLPRQPLPTLQQTCERYVTTLEAIVEGDELKRAKQLVEDFQKPGGVGERLQGSLEKKASNTENWLADFNVNEHLKQRRPVPVFSNPSSFRRTDSSTDKERLRCAAKTIEDILDLKKKIDTGTLPVECVRGIPLCMKQYYQVLSSCRIPGPERDSLVFYSKTDPKYITVAHNCEFFVLDVYNSDGTQLTIDQLCVQLDRICKASPQLSTDPVGILTTQYRKTWNKAYINLMNDETNRESVSAIQRSIFTLCLDRAMPQVSDESSDITGIKQIVHGGGSQCNSGNRWFDKSLQVIIGKDGSCGANFSHANVDGTVAQVFAHAVAAYMKDPEMMRSAMEPSLTDMKETESLPMPQKLHFSITPEIKKDIEEAKQNMDILAQDVDLRIQVFDHFGKDVPKAYKLSPDAFIQMAMQLGYYRMYQRCGTVFEANSMRMFRGGRIDGICATSSASAAFVKGFDDPTKQVTEKMDLLGKSIKAHNALTKMAMSGHSIDGHMMTLKDLAVEENITIPEIFKDTSFDKAFDYNVFTSQVTLENEFLPVTNLDDPNGYCVCYSVKSNYIGFVVTAINSCKETSATQLIQSIENALLDMRTLLEQSQV
ncbi:carnitine O-acetyltransferase-like [Scomber japonicus]|uniref:carnitine O-acetyltransferase-like n=1 Tax=Scomber japonicus TaxID=13676 RepID=UPI00230535CC|nr:carnitine O-acetyltransferase-like [Scomber japonicus]